LAQTRLSVATAQTKVNIASNKAIQRRFQEYRLLLQIGESGGDTTKLDWPTALTLARLARETLFSEYHLALSKLNACRQELIVLQNTADEALVFLTDADQQVARILKMFDSARLSAPEDPVPFSSNSSSTFERPSHLFSFTNEEGSESEDSFDSCESGGGSEVSMVALTR
jgi:hypothetical protein